jgi:hypothetical protein
VGGFHEKPLFTRRGARGAEKAFAAAKILEILKETCYTPIVANARRKQFLQLKS